MKMTLLDMTQKILSSMDSDEINSISDTVEAQQVVDAIETSYYHIASTLDFPDHWEFFELLPSNDSGRPTLMYLPSNVGKLEWIQYDVRKSGETERNMKTVYPLDRVDFFNRMNKLDSSDSDIYQFDISTSNGTFDVRGKNDEFPTYFTTMDDYTLVFDSYFSDLDTTLVGNKTWCYGNITPAFTRDDDFVAELEPRQFTLLFNEAKSQCFNDLKQMENVKAERRARRGWVQAQRKDPTVPKGKIHNQIFPNFGRRT